MERYHPRSPSLGLREPDFQSQHLLRGQVSWYAPSALLSTIELMVVDAPPLVKFESRINVPCVDQNGLVS